MDCYDTALRYSKERIQFDKPIGAFSITAKEAGRDDNRK
jgi:glutaryl-CoA dehydrogenase